MASPMKLPEGSFGLKPVSPEQPNVFKDELDFTHLHFEDNYDRASKTIHIASTFHSIIRLPLTITFYRYDTYPKAMRYKKSV